MTRPRRSFRLSRTSTLEGSVLTRASHRYSRPWWGRHLGLLPSHRGREIPRSALEPGPRSRRLHAGRHPSRKQAPLGSLSRDGENSIPVWTSVFFPFDTSSAVHLRSSPWTIPDAIVLRLFLAAHHHGPLLAAAAQGGLEPAPVGRSRGAYPHLLCSMAAAFRPIGLLSATFVSQFPGEETVKPDQGRRRLGLGRPPGRNWFLGGTGAKSSRANGC